MTRFVGIILGGMLLVGCAEPSTESLDAAASAMPVAFNISGAPTVEFSVPDMMCPESCAVKTKEILSEQPGAKEVVVNFETKTATVAIEEGKFDAKAALAALVDHGFDHSVVQSGATDSPAETAPADHDAG